MSTATTLTRDEALALLSMASVGALDSGLVYSLNAAQATAFLKVMRSSHAWATSNDDFARNDEATAALLTGVEKLAQIIHGL